MTRPNNKNRLWSREWSPPKKNNSQVEKKDLGHKCFECKETFKSFGTPKLGSNPSHAGKNWPCWCGGLLLVFWFFAGQKVGELDLIERYWKCFGCYAYKKKYHVPVLEPRRWKGACDIPTLWAFTVIKHVGFLRYKFPKAIVVKIFWLSAKTMPAFSTSNLHLTYHTGSNASNQRYQHYSIIYSIYTVYHHIWKNWYSYMFIFIIIPRYIYVYIYT